MGMLVYCPTYDAMLPELGVKTAKEELRRRLLKSSLYREASECGELRISCGYELDSCFYFTVSGSVVIRRFRLHKNRRIEVVEGK